MKTNNQTDKLTVSPRNAGGPNITWAEEIGTKV
jgi:hypothetical protein